MNIAVVFVVAGYTSLWIFLKGIPYYSWFRATYVRTTHAMAFLGLSQFIFCEIENTHSRIFRVIRAAHSCEKQKQRAHENQFVAFRTQSISYVLLCTVYSNILFMTWCFVGAFSVWIKNSHFHTYPSSRLFRISQLIRKMINRQKWSDRAILFGSWILVGICCHSYYFVR